MFKKSRQKIVLVIMIVLFVLLIGTLGVIYASSYIEVYRRNQDMLAHHIEIFSLEDFSSNLPLEHPDDNPPGNRENAAFRLSTFYTVALDEQGEILLIKNDGASCSDETLTDIARKASKTMGSGTSGSLLYRCGRKHDCIVVAFMDNTLLRQSITTLFRYTVIFALGALIVIFFISLKAAKWIVKPLEESHLKQKQFISDAGHELKTPISVISANAEILSRQSKDSRWISNIQHETQRMNDLIVQLLELARAEQTKPNFDYIDLSRLVTGEALPFESMAFEKGVPLHLNVSSGIFIQADSLRIKQLVSILLDNALSHNLPGGDVSLTLSKERGYAVLRAINAADPIPPEQIKSLFDRFYRADEARRSENHQYGLGLSIAKAIVTSHKGKITVQCRDKTIEFKVSLPLS